MPPLGGTDGHGGSQRPADNAQARRPCQPGAAGGAESGGPAAELKAGRHPERLEGDRGPSGRGDPHRAALGQPSRPARAPLSGAERQGVRAAGGAQAVAADGRGVGGDGSIFRPAAVRAVATRRPRGGIAAGGGRWGRRSPLPCRLGGAARCEGGGQYAGGSGAGVLETDSGFRRQFPELALSSRPSEQPRPASRGILAPRPPDPLRCGGFGRGWKGRGLFLRRNSSSRAGWTTASPSRYWRGWSAMLWSRA